MCAVCVKARGVTHVLEVDKIIGCMFGSFYRTNEATTKISINQKCLIIEIFEKHSQVIEFR